VDKILETGIIKPSFSEWLNPIVMVKKPNDKNRFLDFRKVNSLSKKDAYSLPNGNSLITHSYISIIDLSQAYFQIPLAKKSRKITHLAFSIKDYYFTRMPYGLTETPATFQKLLDRFI